MFVESPFDTLDTIPLNGRGLNPILQNFYMAIHPLTLYIGYIALTIPFAFALGSIISKDKTDNWVLRSKNWTYFSWIFLSGLSILRIQNLHQLALRHFYLQKYQRMP